MGKEAGTLVASLNSRTERLWNGYVAALCSTGELTHKEEHLLLARVQRQELTIM